MRLPSVILLPLLAVATDNGEGATSATTPTAEEPASVVASIEIDTPVHDRDDRCQEWAESGECESNPDFMLKDCAESCGVEQKSKAYVVEGEDAAVGAFRFAEDYGLDDASVVLEVARQLQGALPEEYKPPQEVTHCGDNKKRPCSAGKLWKRADDLKKADMHDAAGADLIRALMKTGIEVDFIERCQKSLQWAFGSIQRQREREKREAIEQEKIQKRREEEQAAMEEAKKRMEEYERDWVKFGTRVQQELSTKSNAEAEVGPDGTVNTETVDLIQQIQQSFLAEGPQGGNWNETIQLIRKIPGSDKTVDVLLIEAKCHDRLGNYKSALSAAGRLISKAANHDPWINDSPRMMAATLGANAAMELGLSENALSFYQTVLKFDPEQERARKQYRGLKKVIKLMDKAEDQIQKGYNKAAAVHVEDCLSAMRGLDVDSPLFRSKIQLKQCTILAGMGKYEEALEHCDTAVEQRVSNDAVSPAMKKEAHLARGEALLLDMDYDEAVQDFRAAFELTPDDDESKRELQYKLRETQHQQDLWNGGQKDHHFNEHTGFPDGRPPQRDHAKILQLPIDLEQHGKEVKCKWLKKQFKMLVRKYHPDKYKGNKKRAARKFKEVKEAKEIISNEWGC